VRITNDKLIELGRRETEQRAANGDVISGYIIGSVTRNQAIFGGTADIDLVLIHEGHPPTPREVVHLSDQVHLDIIHHSRELYTQPRELRVHPWLGPSICEPIFLYDPQHLFEWAQASARGRFFRSDYIHSRAHAFLQSARQSKAVLNFSNRWLKTYTRTVLEAANAAVSLTGFPVAGRRLVLNLERASHELNHLEVSKGFLQLLGAENVNGWNLPEMLSTWARTYDLAGEISSDPDLSPCRRSYYLSGFQALAEANRPEAVLWTLLTTWDNALHALEAAEKAEQHLPAWEATLERLRLSPTTAIARSEELEHYLDQMENFIEVWAKQNGA
jgi:hypothetical protein